MYTQIFIHIKHSKNSETSAVTHCNTLQHTAPRCTGYSANIKHSFTQMIHKIVL